MCARARTRTCKHACPRRLGVGIRFLGARVTGVCELPARDTRIQAPVLRTEQQAFWTTYHFLVVYGFAPLTHLKTDRIVTVIYLCVGAPYNCMQVLTGLGFPPSVMKFCGVELRPSALVAGSPTCWAILPVLNSLLRATGGMKPNPGEDTSVDHIPALRRYSHTS